MKEIVGRLFHRLERAGMHVDIDTIDADAEAVLKGRRKGFRGALKLLAFDP